MSINLLTMIMLMVIDPGVPMSVPQIEAQKIAQEKDARKQNYAVTNQRNKTKGSGRKYNKDNKQEIFCRNIK